MKTYSLFAALFLVAGLVTGSSARAEDLAKPAVGPDQGSVAEPVVIDHVVYLARLPSPDELMRGAELKATPIVRMDQTADRIVVVYQYGGGRTVTFAYTLLSTAGSAQGPAVGQATGADYPIATPSRAPAVTTVIYAEPETVYYAPRVRYYDPAWDFWTPFVVGVGLGWIGGHGHGGGWHGHDGGHGHDGWHH